MPLEEVASGQITQAEVDKIRNQNTPTTPPLPPIGPGPTAGSAGGPPPSPNFQLPPLGTYPTGKQLAGADRFMWEERQFISNRGNRVEDRDSWILTLPLDPIDNDYNRILEGEKQAAQKRIQERWQKKYKTPEIPTPPGAPTEEEEIKTIKQRGRAYEAEVKQIETTPLFEGTPLYARQQQGTNPVPTGGATGDINAAVTGEEQAIGGALGAAPPAGGFIDPNNPQKTLENGRKSDGWRGSWVFVGYTTVTDSRGNTHKQAKYISDQEAYGALAQYPPEQIRQFQKSFGLAETGVPDPTTMNVWGKIVDATTALNLAGQQVTLSDVFGMYLSGDTKKRSGGGGGGGGGIDISSAKSLLSSTMKELIGREPTEGEARVFWKRLQSQWSGSGGNMDPGQFATDYVRENFTAEAAETTTQSYYSAMLGVLGGGMTGA